MLVLVTVCVVLNGIANDPALSKSIEISPLFNIFTEIQVVFKRHLKGQLAPFPQVYFSTFLFSYSPSVRAVQYMLLDSQGQPWAALIKVSNSFHFSATVLPHLFQLKHAAHCLHTALCYIDRDGQ